MTNADPGFRRRRLLVVFILWSVLVTAFIYAPYAGQGPVICPLHGVVGLPCPGCGLTRSFCALTRLDFPAALAANALGPPLFLLFIVAPLVALHELRLGRRSRLHAAIYSPRAAYPVALFLAGYHLLRLGFWLVDGTLYREYLTTSWTYSLLSRLGWF